MDQHFRFSSFREKLVEHLFVGEMLKVSWQRTECSLEVAKPEVDSRGYDLIIERSGVVRHIQLKASHQQAKAASQKVHIGLAEKPSGCVVWVVFDEATLELGPFLFLGGKPGEALPSLADFKVAKHTKADMQGIKSDRPDVKVVPKARFETITTTSALFDRLFCLAFDQGPIGLQAIEQHFHELIRSRIAHIPAASEISLPRLNRPLPDSREPAWFPVPGMFGGFSYWFESPVQLITESWSRVEQGSGERHLVNEHGFALIADRFV
ncbi:MAG: hypothetical protein JWL98_106 [Xanthomonadaceae bacterium]|nr:hypothetical protein [Xanthomonadaceae bacterium]